MQKREIDKDEEELRQSIIENKANKSKAKHCIKDFSEDVFELTADMMVEDTCFYTQEQKKYEGVAECMLHKYSKLLSVQ